MIGRIISHYKILEKLGEGGMGVVYKAQDTTLDRMVALKFLPAHASINEETKARFLQEGKAAAALNHPHICTIHGVEEDSSNMFIIMEFIDGGTLRGKLPYSSVDDVVSVAMQIGEALQEAHAKGIVHRDIKADNIMLTARGQVKVMDFGLAKLKGSLKLTRTSSTVGTLAYMAPEQIRGGEVDSRSDIFSFGAVVFEMLTGKTPFRGEHEAAMLYSIVNEDPLPLEELRQDLPPLLSNLILRCLEKDPADRYQHMDDIVSELRRTQKKSSGKVMRTSSHIPVQSQPLDARSGVMSRRDIPAGAPLEAPAKSSVIRYGIIATVAVVVLGVVAWFLLSRSGLTVNPNMTTRVLQVPFTQYSYPSLSPDGKWIAFPAADANGKWDIYYMHVNGGEPRKITSDAAGFIQQTADISPDGGQIVYDRPNEDRTSYDIFSISALGGTSHKLAERGGSAQWRPDGQRVGFIRTNRSELLSESGMMEFLTVAADGSGLRREFIDSLFVTTPNYRYNFCWSPDGESIAWIRSKSASSQLLVVHNLETGVEKQLTQGEENLDAMVWTVDNRIIFSSNRGGNTNLWAVPATGGEPVQVTKGAGPDIGLSVATSGNDLVYLQQQRVGFIWTANIDGSSIRQITFDERRIRDASFSPDKKRIAFVMNDPDPLTRKSDVYVVDRDGNNRRRLTTGNPVTSFPQWSRDGRRIMYTIPPTGQGSDTARPTIYVVDADNPGAPRKAGEHFGNKWLDSDHILSDEIPRSYINSISTGSTRQFCADSVTVFSLLDGKHLCYYNHHTSKEGYWVVEIEPLILKEVMKQQGGVIMPVFKGTPSKVSSAPLFTRVPTSLLSDAGNFVQATVDDRLRLIGFMSRREETLPGRFPGIARGSVYLSLDGKEIVFVTPRLSSRLVLLENVFK